MRNLFSILTVLFFVCCPHHGAASQEYTARPLPFISSLASREITTLHQDREGFIWIGTTYGVARYDGHETVVFKSDYLSPNRLTDNSITPLTDSEHYVFIGTQNGLNLFDKQTWKLHPAGNEAFLHTEIKYLFTDSRQNIWIATPQGLYLCDEELNIHRHYSICTGVTSVYEDRDGTVWVLTWGKGMFRMDFTGQHPEAYPVTGSPEIPFVLYQDKEKRYWLGTWGNGLFRFYPDREENERFKKVGETAEHGIFFDITQDVRTGRLWMLSYQALFVFDCTADGSLAPVTEDLGFDRNRMFSKILNDRDGNLWLGAYDNGYLLSFNREPMQVHTLPYIKQQTGFDTNINCMFEDGDGILWFNQERHGIALYDTRTKQCNLNPCPDTPGLEINFIEAGRHKNCAWIASSFVPAVFSATRTGMQIQLTDTVTLAADGSQTGHIIEMHEDRSGYLWTLTERRLFVHAPDKRSLPIKSTALSTACCITETPDGKIWMGNRNGDLCTAVIEEGSVHTRTRYSCRKLLHPHDAIQLICHYDEGKLWMTTTMGGLYCFHPDTHYLVDHTGRSLHGESPVLNLFASGRNVWMVTPSATVRYTPASQSRKVYATEDPYNPVHTYRNRAAFLNRDNRFYTGGHGGFIELFPDSSAQTPHTACRIRLTDIRIQEESILETGAATVWQNTVTIPPTARRIELVFSDCRLDNSGQTRFAYKLEGWDTDWVEAEKGTHSIFYTRLPKGDYILRLCGIDDSGHITGEIVSYRICRQPAWYETWYAYLLYLIIAVACLTGIVRLYTSNLRRKHARLLREELARTKLEYFTSISHELLTPLTVLSCLSDEMEQKEQTDRSFIRTMRDNTTRLKKLIKQVLDFRKIEQNHLPLQVRYGDIASFIRRISRTNFTLLAQKKHITFKTDIFPHEIYGYYDADKLEEILFNLLSNAIKYTPEGRNVGIHARVDETATAPDGNLTKMLHIEVWDEGIGIADTEQSRIFTRFYRSPQQEVHENETNGIGLSLTRELVRLHHGEISVQSEIRKGSRFRVSIPLTAESYTPEEIAEETVELPDNTPDHGTTGTDRPSLLIVDDNHEITDAMERLFRHRYHITSAHNAEEATAVMREQDIDLMVCDFMMPGTNGIEFCRMLKADLSTSHIPIIILTAQQTEETQRACYEAGADGFIAKPFESKVLMARIDNLLHLYRQQRARFQTDMQLDTSTLPYRRNDKDLLNRMASVIENHLQNPDFNMDTLAGELHLSKSTMNRKIKALTGLTPMDFVKNIRIKLACKLLAQPGMPVSDAAYAAGFNDPKYFARCFKEECGMTPTQYQQTHKNTVPRT